MANHTTGAERRNKRMHAIFDKSYEIAARKAGWMQYASGQDVMPPDETQVWWYHKDSPDGDWYNSPAEICRDHNLLG